MSEIEYASGDAHGNLADVCDDLIQENAVFVRVECAADVARRHAQAFDRDAQAAERRMRGEVRIRDPAIVGERKNANLDIAEIARIGAYLRRICSEIDQARERDSRGAPMLRIESRRRVEGSRT